MTVQVSSADPLKRKLEDLAPLDTHADWIARITIADHKEVQAKAREEAAEIRRKARAAERLWSRRSYLATAMGMKKAGTSKDKGLRQSKAELEAGVEVVHGWQRASPIGVHVPPFSPPFSIT